MKRNHLWMLIFSLAGTIFAGYYSLARLFSETCPFNESCPFVLGYPACYFGAIIFLALLVLSILIAFGKAKKKEGLLTATFWVSIAGVIYSFYLSIIDLFFTTCLGGTCTYTLLLPTCVYGLIFYAGILVFTIFSMKKK